MNPGSALTRALESAGTGTLASLAVAVGPDGECHARWSSAAGEREPRFLAYSITKVFTATLVLRQVEAGRLQLDDRLARWFPEIERAADIRLSALLQHTAGIPDYGGLAAYHEAVRRSPGSPWQLDDYAAHTWERGLAFAPEKGWAYSNPGYLLLRRILESVTGNDYAALLTGEIAAPLCLARTAEVRTPEDMRDLVPASSTLLAPDNAPRDLREAYHPGWVSHGVIGAPASEIVAFLQALFAGRVLRPPSLAAMRRLVRVPGDFPPVVEPSYGLGLMADARSSYGPTFGHNGGGPGSTASAFHAPDHPGGPVTACAMATSENEHTVTGMVNAIFEALA